MGRVWLALLASTAVMLFGCGGGESWWWLIGCGGALLGPETSGRLLASCWWVWLSWSCLDC